MRRTFLYRMRIVVAVVLLFSLGVVVRLYQIQIADGHAYMQRANAQYASSGDGLFDRGSIYFTRKDGTLISAATLASGYMVAINPQTIVNPEAAYQAITKLASTTVTHQVFLQQAANKRLVYVEVANHLSTSAGDTLAAENIPGVEVLRERWPIYPGGDMAAKTLGIISYGQGNTLTGQSGLEAQYNKILSRTGSGIFKNFFAELFSQVGSNLVNTASAHEGDVVTSIEPQVEARLMQDIKAVNQKYSSQSSGGIIMDPKTGAIYAIASYPTFNPNNLHNVNPTLLVNPLVSHVYEWGSIMKPITMDSGLSAGVITPQSTYNDTGCFHVDGARICNWNYHAYGVIPMKIIIEQSLNVGASWIAEQLGHKKMRYYFTKIFGTKTGVDLPNEANALISNLYKPQQIYYDTASFGEGIAVTAMQMIRALAAVANGGKLVQPHLATSIILQNGVQVPLNWSSSTQVFTPTASRETAVMMDGLFSQVLYGGKDRIPGINVAMKTGTAQLPTPTGTYYTNKFFNSEVDFFPSFNPKFIILLYTDDPHATYASDTLSPTLLDLTHFLINYYNITPTQTASTTAPGS